MALQLHCTIKEVEFSQQTYQSWFTLRRKAVKTITKRSVSRPDSHSSPHYTSLTSFCIRKDVLTKYFLTEPSDCIRMGGDAEVGHWWGGHGVLLWVRARREKTTLGQNFHSIRESRLADSYLHICRYVLNVNDVSHSQFNYMHECFERVFCELKWRKEVQCFLQRTVSLFCVILMMDNKD